MKIYLLFILLLSTTVVRAEKDHDHDEKGHDEASKSHDDEKGHDDEHGEEQKLPGGVTFFEDESGEFSLKEKVIQNFGIVLSNPVSVSGVVELPEMAIVRSLKETTVFILKGDRFKSIPVKITSSSNGTVKVSGIMAGTKVVLKGNNFLKTILLSLEEGPSEGHGH